MARLGRRGITSMEYAVLVAAIIVALVSMQVFLRRAISYRWKEAADQAFGGGRQYEPGVTTVTHN